MESLDILEIVAWEHTFVYIQFISDEFLFHVSISELTTPLQEKERKRLHDEAEKEERRREKEECDMQKQLRRQQEEAEKDKKRKAKEEAELKKQLALQKQASLMEQFLKRNKTTSQHGNSLNKATTSMSSTDMIERKPETVTADMDSVLVENVGIEAEAIWKSGSFPFPHLVLSQPIISVSMCEIDVFVTFCRSHLNSWHCIGRLIRSERKVHWGIRQKPKTELVKELKLTTNSEMTCDEDLIVEKHVDGWIDSNVDGRLSQINIDRPLPNCQKLIRSMQLLQFDKSNRPAFYGVWARKR